MSFAVSDEQGDFEYASTGMNGLFANRANLAKPWFHRMLVDVIRFQRAGRELLASHAGAGTVGAGARTGGLDIGAGRRGAGNGFGGPSLGHWVEQLGFGRPFIDRVIVPQASAVWSADPEQMWSFPARFLVEFFANHG